MISTNNIENTLKVLLKVIKNIFCVQEYSENCQKCNICHLIDLGNLPTLRIIEPDGSFIKKDQILSLESSYSKSSQITDVSIYIIKNCEKMNKEAANTMLKFLEEPSSNVIGFFLTNSINSVIPTVKSRCQHIDINYQNKIYDELNISEDKYNEFLDKILKYLLEIENEKKNNIICNKIFFSEIEKEDIKIVMQIILNIYQNEFNCKINNEQNEQFKFLSNYSIINIERKINLLIEMLNEINYNVNMELLLDRFALEMEVINNETL